MLVEKTRTALVKKTVGNRLYGRREKDGTITLNCTSVRCLLRISAGGKYLRTVTNFGFLSCLTFGSFCYNVRHSHLY